MHDIYKISSIKEFLSRHHTMRCEIKFLNGWCTTTSRETRYTFSDLVEVHLQ